MSISESIYLHINHVICFFVVFIYSFIYLFECLLRNLNYLFAYLFTFSNHQMVHIMYTIYFYYSLIHLIVCLFMLFTYILMHQTDLFVHLNTHFFMGHISDLFWKEYLIHFPYHAHHTSVGSVSNSSYYFLLTSVFLSRKIRSCDRDFHYSSTIQIGSPSSAFRDRSDFSFKPSISDYSNSTLYCSLFL